MIWFVLWLALWASVFTFILTPVLPEGTVGLTFLLICAALKNW